VVAAIDRLVDARERMQPQVGAGRAPARERTVLGLGMRQGPAPRPPMAQAASAAPAGRSVPARERTVLGLGVAGAMTAAKARPKERSTQEPPPEDWDVPDIHEAPTKETEIPGAVDSEAVVSQPAPEAMQPRARAPEYSIAIDLVAKKPEV